MATGESAATFNVFADGRPVSRMEFFQGLASSSACRTVITRCLVGLSAEQVYWETPPLSVETADARFEFVAVTATLSAEPDSSSFRQFFTPGELAASFANLRGDATLVVPTDQRGATRYNYLLSFLRTGEAAQSDALWELLGNTVVANVGDAPIWVSTAGGGVPWLHFRLDSRPKYYRHSLYRQQI